MVASADPYEVRALNPSFRVSLHRFILRRPKHNSGAARKVGDREENVTRAIGSWTSPRYRRGATPIDLPVSRPRCRWGANYAEQLRPDCSNISDSQAPWPLSRAE